MRQVEIEVHSIASTRRHPVRIREWLGAHGVSQEKIEEYTDQEGGHAGRLVELAGRRCYLSFEPGLNPNVTKIREGLLKYITNVLKSGHGSVLEHATHTFAIEGVSRVFTAEMNRHRAGVSISEGSMRYISFKDIPFWMPLSIRENPDDPEAVAQKKATTRAVFELAFKTAEELYGSLFHLWGLDDDTKEFPEKKLITSMLRRIIPMGVATGGVWTLNLRALRHIIALRCAPSAEEEICYVVGKMAAIMAEQEPEVFGDFVQTPQGYWVPAYPKV